MQVIPPDFDWNTYLLLNKDILPYNKKKAIEHYIKHGIHENRKYKFENIPVDFDWQNYIKYNEDVSQLDEIQCKEHYDKYGFYENRKYKEDEPNSQVSKESEEIKKDVEIQLIENIENFNWKDYIIMNKDIIFQNEVDAKKHYEDFGFYEKRRYNASISFDKYAAHSNLFDICINISLNIKDYDVKNYNYNVDNNISRFKNIIHYHLQEEKEMVMCSTIQNQSVYSVLPNSYLKNIKSFILIVDFPKAEGGVSHFIDTIINQYKKNTIFIIARNRDGSLELNINEDYLLKDTYDETYSIQFLEENKNKISKIFVNHFLNHSVKFINTLFLINREITTITHDYSMIMKKEQLFYHELYNPENHIDKNVIDINKFDYIITQNIKNMTIFKNHVEETKKIIITSLPDYKNTFQSIKTNNSKIVIAIIGNITYIKGLILVKNIIDFFKSNELVEIIIFGKINIKYENVYEYSSIYELNELFIIHKPNMLIETSLWPETYCYTLTLSMITKLPILYIKKPFVSVIEDRLSSYPLAFSFCTMNELKMLVEKVKQNYFFTIKPSIYFNTFWNDYFSNDKIEYTPKNIDYACSIIYKNVVFITSKIYCNEGSASQNTPMYNKKERFIQTIETIQNIHIHIPNVYIFLMDNSKMELFEFNILNNMVDDFINITNDPELNYYTNEYDTFFSEILQHIKFFDYFYKKYDKNYKVKAFFKISGRYLFNETFNYNEYVNNNNIFKRNINKMKENYYYSSFYKLDGSNLLDFYRQLKNIYYNKSNIKHKEVDYIFPKNIINPITEKNHVGITQRFSWKEEDKI